MLGLYRPILLCLGGNNRTIIPAARAIQRINSFTIVLLWTPIVEVVFLESDIVCIMTQIRIYGENSLGVRIYFTLNLQYSQTGVLIDQAAA